MELKDKNLYYVGGVVRDEILGVKSVDIDLCFEGNAIDFAKKNGYEIIKTNDSLGTVRVVVDGKEIDIASTRCEYYPQKGHLPILKEIGCSLKEDLIRRDFTIYAMAKRTTDGEIIDYYGGMDDIKAKALRVLHNESFIDDPTRIIRGLKFAVRFDFELENETKYLQNKYLKNINYDMSYHRLKQELVDAFSLNKKEVFNTFVNQEMYKLLGEDETVPNIDLEKAEDLIKKNPTKLSWLIYLGYFNLSKLPLTRAEKRVLEWAKKLETQPQSNNTPLESVLLHKVLKRSSNV